MYYRFRSIFDYKGCWVMAYYLIEDEAAWAIVNQKNNFYLKKK